MASHHIIKLAFATKGFFIGWGWRGESSQKMEWGLARQVEGSLQYKAIEYHQLASHHIIRLAFAGKSGFIGWSWTDESRQKMEWDWLGKLKEGLQSKAIAYHHLASHHIIRLTYAGKNCFIWWGWIDELRQKMEWDWLGKLKEGLQSKAIAYHQVASHHTNKFAFASKSFFIPDFSP